MTGLQEWGHFVVTGRAGTQGLSEAMWWRAGIPGPSVVTLEKVGTQAQYGVAIIHPTLAQGGAYHPMVDQGEVYHPISNSGQEAGRAVPGQLEPTES